jgi:transcriptional regulator with XRE-family HTH domain
MTENYIGKNLKYLRRKSGLKQADIRSKLGITRSTWSNYENGNTTPSINDLINFSRFFGISLDELILQDLGLKDPLPVKEYALKKVNKPVVYAMNDTITATGEPDIVYVLNEIKKLREEIDSIKNNNSKN